MLWDALCSLYGEDRAKTNFPASDYAHYLALAAQHAAAGQAAEPLANASQLVEELQQVVSSPSSGSHALLNCPADICKAKSCAFDSALLLESRETSLPGSGAVRLMPGWSED